jgi:hypothetical protein
MVSGLLGLSVLLAGGELYAQNNFFNTINRNYSDTSRLIGQQAAERAALKKAQQRKKKARAQSVKKKRHGTIRKHRVSRR